MGFKVGQRVRCIKTPDGHEMVGWEGTVTDIDYETPYPIFVTFDLDPNPMWDWPMLPEELELVK